MSEELCEAVRLAVAKGEPDIDPAVAHIWNWFWDIHRGRQAGLSGLLPFSATELKAWADLTGNVVRREEWEIIRVMDSAFLAACQASSTSPDAPPPKAGEGRDLTPALFDAVFG